MENKKSQIKFFIYNKHNVKIKKKMILKNRIFVEKIFHCKKIFIFLMKLNKRYLYKY